MKLAVFGATGGIGRHIVKLALAQGHSLTAIVRTPSKLQPQENLDIVQGNVLSLNSTVLAGHDAVLLVLSVGNSREPTRLYSEGTANVLDAMKENGVKRFMGVSASGFINDPNDKFLVKYAFKPLLQRMLKNPYNDLQRMEQVVMSSGLDWTLIRPARLVDGDAAGVYRTNLDGVVSGGSSIARADVAAFMINHVDDTTVVGKAVGIAY